MWVWIRSGGLISSTRSVWRGLIAHWPQSPEDRFEWWGRLTTIPGRHRQLLVYVAGPVPV